MFSCLTSSVHCSSPGNPQRGSTNYTNTTEGSVAFYSCDQYLVPEGRMRANCTRNGWSPIKPGLVNCTEGILLWMVINLLVSELAFASIAAKLCTTITTESDSYDVFYI